MQQQNSLLPALATLLWLLLLLQQQCTLASCKPCCFRYRGWDNPCENVTCPDNAQCVPAVNMHQYKCTCPTDCWDVGDSDDSGEVCGSDGVTYASLCHLQRASCHAAVMVRPKLKGDCDPCGHGKLVCPAGQRCVLDSERRPRCHCGDVCDRVSTTKRLVCASNGVTYRDECHMAHESCMYSLNLTKLSDADCPEGKYCRTGCPHPYMQCRVDDASAGSSGSVCRCPEACPPVLSPICGSDNVTYDSLCHLKRSACLNNIPPGKLLPVHRGDCGLTGTCRLPRYRCQFGGVCRAAISERQIGRHRVGYGLSVTCERPNCLWSESPDDAPSSDRWLLMSILTAAGGEFNARVCGTDGVTYKSECHLRQRAFDLRRDIRVSEQGSCNACQGYNCPFYGFCRVNSRGAPECYCHSVCGWAPNMPSVCGSDGNSYLTECELRLQACNRQQDIQVVPRGSCGGGAAAAKRRRRHGGRHQRARGVWSP